MSRENVQGSSGEPYQSLDDRQGVLLRSMEAGDNDQETERKLQEWQAKQGQNEDKLGVTKFFRDKGITGARELDFLATAIGILLRSGFFGGSTAITICNALTIGMTLAEPSETKDPKTPEEIQKHQEYQENIVKQSNNTWLAVIGIVGGLVALKDLANLYSVYSSNSSIDSKTFESFVESSNKDNPGKLQTLKNAIFVLATKGGELIEQGRQTAITAIGENNIMMSSITLGATASCVGGKNPVIGGGSGVIAALGLVGIGSVQQKAISAIIGALQTGNQGLITALTLAMVQHVAKDPKFRESIQQIVAEESKDKYSELQEVVVDRGGNQAVEQRRPLSHAEGVLEQRKNEEVIIDIRK